MSYQQALEAAGAEVLAFAEFGSYQGDWFAKVRFDGETFFVRDYYGSCSICDAFEAEMGWEPWDDATDAEKLEYAQKLQAFGARYLEPQERLTFDDALKAVSKNLEWDADAAEMVEWLKEQGQ